MEPAGPRHPLDGLDAAALALEAEHEAREHRLAVHEHRAGAALAELAAVLGARQAQVLAQHLEQRLVRREGRLDRLAVHDEADQALAGDRFGFLRPRAIISKSNPFVLMKEMSRLLTDQSVKNRATREALDASSSSP